MLSNVKHWRASVYIYYHKTNTCRIPTGINIDKKYFSESKLILKSSNRLDYRELNSAIVSIKQKVDDTIMAIIDKGLNPTGKLVKQYFYEDNFVDQEDKEVRSLLDHFVDFCEFKKQSRITYNTFKGVISLKNALIDFQNETNKNFLLEDINTNWLQEFELFLSEKRKPGSLTKGGMNDNTIAKRFKTFKQFWNHIVDQEIVESNKFLRKYKIKGYVNDPLTLTKDELTAIKEFQTSSLGEKKAKDMFIFCCMTGMRYSDMISTDRDDIKDGVVQTMVR